MIPRHHSIEQRKDNVWHLQYENRTALARTRVRIEYEGEGPFVNCEYGFGLEHIFSLCLWRRFRQGGYPQTLPGTLKSGLAALAVAKCVFLLILKDFGSI